MQPSVRWAWSLNAAASVLGSVGALVLALYLGLVGTLLVGGALIWRAGDHGGKPRENERLDYSARRKPQIAAERRREPRFNAFASMRVLKPRWVPEATQRERSGV